MSLSFLGWVVSLTTWIVSLEVGHLGKVPLIGSALALCETPRFRLCIVIAWELVWEFCFYLLSICLYKLDKIGQCFRYKRVLRRIIGIANFQVLKICGLKSTEKTERGRIGVLALGHSHSFCVSLLHSSGSRKIIKSPQRKLISTSNIFLE